MKKFLQRATIAIITDLTYLFNQLATRTMQTLIVIALFIHCLYGSYKLYEAISSNINEHEKPYWGSITGKQESSGKYSSSFWLGFKPDVISTPIELRVTPITYANSRIGERTCFNLRKEEVYPEPNRGGDILYLTLYTVEALIIAVILVSALAEYLFIPFFGKD